MSTNRMPTWDQTLADVSSRYPPPKATRLERLHRSVFGVYPRSFAERRVAMFNAAIADIQRRAEDGTL